METTYAREQLSEMTDITETTLMQTFDWDRDYGPLYRACPTAFWLAPDASDVLPAVAGPILPRHDIIPVGPSAPAPLDLATATGQADAVFAALLVAGPVFAASELLLTGITHAGFAQAIGPALASIIFTPLTILFGMPLALLPVMTGVVALAALGRRWTEWREPWVWTATGGALGLMIALAVQADAPTGLALVATSLACARLARHRVAWIDADDERY